MRFDVWAPRPSAVEIEVDGARHPMADAGAGWRTADVPTRPGATYAFVLDGGPPRPDPRSAHQPEGPHGPSQVVDHTAFAWTDHDFRPAPLSSAVLYELHVGTFTPGGTFDSAIERLDYLVDLGVTHVELMPVCEFPGTRGWGYDGVNLWAPHHALGGPDGLKRLVDALHQRGLAAILDVVYNHLGPSGNYLAEFGPYFTDHYATPWGDAINFDQAGSDEVRRFFIDNACAWLRDYHFDALRLDAVHAIVDMSAVHFLEELAIEVEKLAGALGRDLDLIAESDLNDPRLVTSREAGGYGLRAQWSDDFHHALHITLTGEQTGYYADFTGAADLVKSLRDVFVNDGRHSGFRQRRHGRPTDGLPFDRFLAYAQNHDQVGNRARGDRLGALVEPAALKLAAAITLLGPCVPMLFAGEEWGAATPFCYFTDHDDPALGEAVRAGRRAEFAAFGWDPEQIPDPQALATFEQSRLDWTELRRPDCADLLEWHRRLIALRRAEPDLTNPLRGATSVEHDAATGVITLQRGHFTIIANTSRQPAKAPAPASVEPVLRSADVTASAGNVHLPPLGVAVLRRA